MARPRPPADTLERCADQLDRAADFAARMGAGALATELHDTATEARIAAGLLREAGRHG